MQRAPETEGKQRELVTRAGKGRNVKDVTRKAKTAWMTPEEFTAIRETVLELTQAQFAEKLDITSTTVSAYETGRTPIPKTLQLLMDGIKKRKIKL